MAGSLPGHARAAAKTAPGSPECRKAADYGHFRAGEALAVDSNLSHLWGWRVPEVG